MKRLLGFLLLFLLIVEVYAEDNRRANKQLLNAINHNDIEQVIDACNKGADFMTFTDRQLQSIDYRNYLNIYNNILNNYNGIDVAKTNIAFNRFNLVLFEENDTLKAIILNRLANTYTTIGDYDEAESLYKDVVQIRMHIFGKQHFDYAASLNNLALLYKNIGDYTSAEPLFKEALQIYKQETTQPNYATNLSNLASLYHDMGNYTAAVQLNKEALHIRKEILGEQHPDYAASLNNLGMLYQDMGDYISAEPLLKEALQIRKKTFGEHHQEYAQGLNNLAMLYRDIGDYTSAEHYQKEALSIDKDVFGEQHPTYAQSLNNLASLYQDMGDYVSAEPLLKKAQQIIRDILGKQHQAYATILNNLAMLYQDMGNYISAEPLLKEALQIRKDVLGELHPNYASSLNNLSVLYLNMCDYASAEPLLKKALQINKNIYGEQHPAYAKILNNLGMLYQNMGDYASAEPLLKEALHIRKQVLGELHPDYAITLNCLASLYIDNGDYVSAESHLKDALQINKNIYGEQHPKYAKILNNLASLYHYMGDYVSVESYLKDALQINKNIYGEFHPDYASSLNNLSVLYQNMGDYVSAEPLLKKALQIDKNIYGEQHPYYATSLNNLAILYRNIGDYTSAEHYQKEALSIDRDVFGGQHPKYATCLNNLGMLYKEMGDYASAEPLLKKAQQIIRTVFGEQHHEYAASLNNLAMLYQDKGEYASVEPLYIESHQLLTKLVESNFSFMSERQREAFWQKEKGIFEYTYPSFVYQYYPQKKSISSFAYDNELFLKGLLLNETQQIQNAVLASGDSILIDTYNHLRHTKERIIFLQQQPLDKQFGLDSLQTLAEQLDKQLVLGSKEYRQSQETWAITWENVRDKLSDNDVAIEFSSFEIEEDSIWNKKIVALLLRKYSTYPEYIVIGNEDEIFSDAGITYSYDGNGAELYSKIWNPLKKYIEEGETVYFSPSGILYQINLSALPVNEKETIGDKYNLVQLSSTRELAIQRDTYNHDNAVLYGGLVYNVDEEEMAETSAQYAEYNLSSSRGLQDNSVRDGVKYLSGTKTEIEQIGNTCRQHNILTISYTSKAGNEESFKALSGKTNNILHIATHGFFFPNEKAKHSKLFMLRGDEQQNERYIDPLLRSGLLFAGANKAWSGNRDQLPEGVQDGILTAKEISLLNLSQTDLVVLSACETGKGEISSDGVFGLQRGFKQAGVNSLLMSLWKVDDKATQMLMTEFYRNLLEGNSKIESLKKAQQYVKSQPGYEEPEYWAGFILLDALN